MRKKERKMSNYIFAKSSKWCVPAAWSCTCVEIFDINTFCFIPFMPSKVFYPNIWNSPFPSKGRLLYFSCFFFHVFFFFFFFFSFFFFFFVFCLLSAVFFFFFFFFLFSYLFIYLFFLIQNTIFNINSVDMIRRRIAASDLTYTVCNVPIMGP